LRTNPIPGRVTAAAALLAGVALAVGAFIVLAGDAASTENQHPLADDDRVRLGEFTLTAPSTVPLVSIDDAFGAAGREYDWAQMPGRPDIAAALASLTVGPSQGPEAPLNGRLVWIVHVSGIEQYVAGPWTPDGPLPGRVLRHAYVFIDATTGEFLMTSWTE
jgi:hypothetical protein